MTKQYIIDVGLWPKTTAGLSTNGMDVVKARARRSCPQVRVE